MGSLGGWEETCFKVDSNGIFSGPKKVNPPAAGGRVCEFSGAGLDPADVGRLVSFRALQEIEFDSFAFIQRAVAILLNGGIVHEYVFAGGTLNEAVSLSAIEPLYRTSFSHNRLLSPLRKWNISSGPLRGVLCMQHASRDRGDRQTPGTRTHAKSKNPRLRRNVMRHTGSHVLLAETCGYRNIHPYGRLGGLCRRSSRQQAWIIFRNIGIGKQIR